MYIAKGGPVFRALSALMILLYLAACSSTTTLTALGVHSAADRAPIKRDQVYRVAFTDGTTQDAVGTAISMERNSICLYYGEKGKWIRHPLSEVDEIYLVTTDHLKKRRRTALITGAAVLAAFAAAGAGGYYLEQKLK